MKKKAKKPIPVWSYKGIRCFARTKSEARSVLKKQLNVKRLPIGAEVVRIGEL